MKEKIASLLLICLVALSIVYVCSSTALSSHTTQSIDAVPSRPTTVTEEPCQNVNARARAEPIPAGDPIDNPIPHIVEANFQVGPKIPKDFDKALI